MGVKMLKSILSLLSLLVGSESSRILAMYPTPSVSHQVVFRPLMMELAKRGHEVTVITADPMKIKMANFTEIDVHDLSYNYWKEHVIPTIDGDSKNSFNLLTVSLNGLVHIVEKQFLTDEVQAIIKSGKKFDLIFTEAFVTSCLVLSHIFKAPVIQFSSFSMIYPQYHRIGASSHLFLYPEVIRKKLVNLTLWDKIEALYYDLQFKHLQWNIKGKENDMIKRNFGPNAPSIDDLVDNVQMLFLNVNPVWDNNRPVPPSVIYTGGLHQKSPKDLPKDLQTFLDNSKHGVIYMSFGSNVDPTILSPDRIRMFCNVFSRLPYDILWKWNGDQLPGKPDNVRISKWLPQSDLLLHPKIKLFITQAGLQSTDESITAGIPLLAFPMLGDQWYNAEKYLYHEIGLRLDFETFSIDQLERSIKEVIENKSYKENIVRLGSLMRDQPQTPIQRAVWWTEHVLRHGGQHLRSPQANISWFEYLMLDIVLAALGMMLVVIICLVVVVKMLVGSSVKLKKS